jgi:putative ABC transport system permease protein
VVGVFTFLPIYQLQELKPKFIMQKEVIPLKRGWLFYLAILMILLFFTGMVLWKLQDLRISLYFVGGVIGFVLLTAFLTEMVLLSLKQRRIKALAPRQALRGLFRPRNATRAIIITLAASLAVIFCIYLIERNLDASFVSSFPPDAPNLFFVDIQPDQREGFVELLGMETDFFPVIRSRIRAVNGVEIDRDAERDRMGDNLARTFALSYRSELLEGERIIQGSSLFNDDVRGAPVSLLDDMLRVRDFELGDVISFEIQGVPLDATISSIRTETEESSQPIFDFILPPDALLNAPQTIFTAVTVPAEQIKGIQNRIVAAYPNVSVVNVSEAINTLAEIVGEITRIIRFFTLFSIVAGLLIIISSVFATRFARIQEAVYFKVLGAKQRFVLKVFALENIFLGLLSGLLAVLLAQIGSWLIMTRLFQQNYNPFIVDTLLLVIATTLLVTTVGLLASVSILTHRPITFLREQTVE